MTKPTPKGNWRSAQPIQGLSKRAQEQLKPRSFGVYSKAAPSGEKK